MGQGAGFDMLHKVISFLIVKHPWRCCRKTHPVAVHTIEHARPLPRRQVLGLCVSLPAFCRKAFVAFDTDLLERNGKKIESLETFHT